MLPYDYGKAFLLLENFLFETGGIPPYGVIFECSLRDFDEGKGAEALESVYDGH